MYQRWASSEGCTSHIGRCTRALQPGYCDRLERVGTTCKMSGVFVLPCCSIFKIIVMLVYLDRLFGFSPAPQFRCGGHGYLLCHAGDGPRIGGLWWLSESLFMQRHYGVTKCKTLNLSSNKSMASKTDRSYFTRRTHHAMDYKQQLLSQPS